MSVRTCYPWGRRREEEQERLREEAGASKRREDKEKECMQQLSQCPACNQGCDVVLILPCSHTMCGPCITAAEGARSGQHRGVSPPVCSVLCPRCRHPVELPCRSWSSATSSLPKHPTLSPACVSRETGSREGESGDPLQCVQVDTRCHDVCDVTEQSSVHEPGSSSTEPPEDGAVDLREEEMEQSVYGLSFSLDPSTAPPSLHLSNSSLTVTYKEDSPPGPPRDPLVRRSPSLDPPGILVPLVCADVVIRRGQYYWEVDVCNSSVYRIGVSAVDASCGWWLDRHGPSFCAVYDGSLEPLCTVPPQIKTLGVFLNIGGGALSFHNPLTQEHLATLSTRFHRAGVRPALGLRQGRLRVRCGLPPPAHVFLSKDSTYRGPRGAGGGRWQRELPFHSVRKVIQKFEELAVSDSDSGLVSSFGSSCSTLVSLPDLGIPGMFPSGPTGQETAAE
ncbi:uncharacterized protein LOC132980184 [Labrus mixtus]|uniref:uncharacterized protein LOC132980184 n=1 Tax=Labrus mixtus TaxID=508554 RepID=UPI0029C0970E|nr:uncharacterized protein LOC132980184 [Labrus mixtus]